jgi:flagella basal body P-ring formation protein FlgA
MTKPIQPTHTLLWFAGLMSAALLLGLPVKSSVAATADPSQEQAFQSHDTIHELVRELLKQKVDQKLHEPEIQLKKINPRVQLPACETPLEVHDRNPQRITGRVTVGVKCLMPAWQIFVSATLEGKLPVVLTTQGILKEAVIKESDVKLSYLPYKQVPSDSLIQTETAIGMRTKKAIGPNEPLNVRDLQPPYWVFSKQSVTLITKIGDIEVKTRGTVLEDGVEGQQVTVENASSKKTVKGIVIAPNTVLVP